MSETGEDRGHTPGPLPRYTNTHTHTSHTYTHTCATHTHTQVPLEPQNVEKQCFINKDKLYMSLCEISVVLFSQGRGRGTCTSPVLPATGTTVSMETVNTLTT